MGEGTRKESLGSESSKVSMSSVMVPVYKCKSVFMLGNEETDALLEDRYMGNNKTESIK